MRWKRGRKSQNVEDRRGRSAFGGGGLVRFLPLLLSIGRRGGIGAVVVTLVVLWVLSGGLPDFLTQGDAGPVDVVEGVDGDESAAFVSVILASTEDVWAAIFQGRGSAYEPPRLVLFDDRVASACGFQSAATGPFYCPSDGTIYLDLEFFRQLAQLGAEGDFAAAYVVGHEVGHHVQNLLGTSEQVRRAQAGADRAESNRLSVALELQADCYAGVWGGHLEDGQEVTLSPGDVEEGLAAARAIGDDRLQRRSGGVIRPETFTHGTSEQRARWLRAGLASGDPGTCDTFEG